MLPIGPGDGGPDPRPRPGQPIPVVPAPVLASYSHSIPIVFGKARVNGGQVVFFENRRWFGKPTMGSSADVLASLIQIHADEVFWDGKDGEAACVVIALCEGPISSATADVWRDKDTIDKQWLTVVHYREITTGGSSVSQVTVSGDISKFKIGDIIMERPVRASSFATITGISGQVISHTPSQTWTTGGVLDILPAVEVSTGARTDPGWATGMSSPDPETIYFGGTACLRSRELALTGGKIPDISVEVVGFEGSVDCSPADVISRILTETTWGRGWDSSRIDVDYGGDLMTASSFRTYCTAMGFTIAGCLQGSDSTRQVIESICEVTNSVPVPAPGKVRILPLGDTAVGSYTPPSTVTDIDEGDLLEPPEVRRRGNVDTYTAFPVTYVSRERKYGRAIQESMEVAVVEDQGGVVRRASPVDSPWIISDAHAQKISLLMAQASTRLRSVHTIKLGPRHSLLEPGDMIRLSVASLGLSQRLMRIKTIEEDGEILTVEAVETPTTVSTSATHSTPVLYSGGEVAERYPQTYSDPSTIPPGEVPRDSSTPGQDWDNLFPNGNSEAPPPLNASAATLASPEFANRYNAGAGAYAGSFVRALDASTGSGPALKVPCSPGHAFYFEGQTESSDGDDAMYLEIRFYDSAGTQAGSTATSAYVQGTSYALAKVSATAPAAAVEARFWYKHASPGTAYFDALYVRRVVGRPVLVPVGEQISASSGTSEYDADDNAWHDVPNLSVDITTTGRPVLLAVQPDGGGDFYAGGYTSGAGSTQMISTFGFARGGTRIATFRNRVVGAAASNISLYNGASFMYLDTPAAGTYTYTFQINGPGSGNTAFISRAKLLAFEL